MNESSAQAMFSALDDLRHEAIAFVAFGLPEISEKINAG